ncbi:fumarylacetoacetate hydrolase family protein [Lipingzhangella sp. LS1_29]|uniref:Fumarylacetoacetate hydrolase family protein n=1 Tax=Lipingzhangella rawalii TaxID=2055835 RepID=A0ABU2HB87_9ACTN|nr:fumarylacetoacetate hydrolase family protein [Lipingzhangella rawalii]MDS1272591.1 fumarylacetoacetate hydrolase family protein [Lipingzhangella rawalii]
MTEKASESMRINMRDVSQAARTMLAAEQSATACPPLTADWSDLDMATAYTIQDEALDQRRQRGETLIGIKLGLTSRAKQIRMGIDTPSLAWLTDAMVLPFGEPLTRTQMIHPRAEPEIVFILKDRLSGPGITAATALRAVGQVYGGIEIIDSRFQDFSFTASDAVADNASSARFVLGPIARAPDGLDLTQEACLLEVDGEVVDAATGAAVQGHPAEALALAANQLAERGISLEPGWIILTGGMTDAVPVPPDTQITARFTNLGATTIAGGTSCPSSK